MSVIRAKGLRSPFEARSGPSTTPAAEQPRGGRHIRPTCYTDWALTAAVFAVFASAAAVPQEVCGGIMSNHDHRYNQPTTTRKGIDFVT